MTRALLPGLISISLLSSPPSEASDGLRCANRLVSVGASQPEVIAKCGPPASVKQRRMTRRILVSDTVEEYEEIELEQWLYDFGPHAFLQELTFENGALVDVRSGSYGTQAGQPPADQPRD